MRIKVSLITLLLFCFAAASPSFAQSLGINVKKLTGLADDSRTNTINFSLENNTFELRASKKINTNGINEIMVYPEGYDGYDGPEEDNPVNLFPRLTLAKGLRFDPKNVYRSEDSSLIVLQIVKGKELQWLFVAQDNTRELARLPFADVSLVSSNRLQLNKSPPDKLKKAIAAIVPQPEWKKYLWDEHNYKIYTAEAILSDWSDKQIPKGSDASAAKLLRELMPAKKQAIDPKILLGEWRVRSLQSDSENLYLYTFFKATIRADANGIIFEKTSGSQRRMGRLYKDSAANKWVFLGGSYVNDDKPIAYSVGGTKPDAAEPKPSDSVGVFYQISSKRAMMILDAESTDEYEIYELVR
jgi:Domain of unknown function (DUF4893)